MARTLKEDDKLLKSAVSRDGRKLLPIEKKKEETKPDPQQEMMNDFKSLLTQMAEFSEKTISQMRDMQENILKVVSSMGPVKVDINADNSPKNFKHRVVSRDDKGMIQEVETVEVDRK